MGEDQLAAEFLAQWPWTIFWKKNQMLLVFIEKNSEETSRTHYMAN